MISVISDRVPRQPKGVGVDEMRRIVTITPFYSVNEGFTADRCAPVEIHFIVIQDDNFGR